MNESVIFATIGHKVTISDRFLSSTQELIRIVAQLRESCRESFFANLALVIGTGNCGIFDEKYVVTVEGMENLFKLKINC